MEGLIKNAIFVKYGLYDVLSYEESDNRGFLTFNCGQGTYIGVMAKYADEVHFFKYERSIKNED